MVTVGDRVRFPVVRMTLWPPYFDTRNIKLLPKAGRSRRKVATLSARGFSEIRQQAFNGSAAWIKYDRRAWCEVRLDVEETSCGTNDSIFLAL